MALALILCLPLLLTGCSKEGPASAEFAALEAEYSAADESIETIEESEELVARFKPRFEALATEYWGTEGALDAELWLLSVLSLERDREARAAALKEMTDEIFAEYADSRHMEKLANYRSLYSESQREEYFGSLQESSPHANVRAAFLYAAARDADIQVLYYGADGEEGEALENLRKQNLDLLVSEYADVPYRNITYGVAAEAMLNAHSMEDLAIGKQAPDIMGANVDGEEMRLSDFLGKVVVLDFWGDW
ncbi:peroxiredoxin family protein [Gemmatimonadota bacterium]